VDKFAIFGTILACGSINANDPKTAKITFAGTPVAVSVPKTMQHGLIRPTKELRTSAILTFGHLDDLFVVFPTNRTSLYTSHISLSCEPLGAGSPAIRLDLPVIYTQQPQLIGW
jgi:hypothetical protein